MKFYQTESLRNKIVHWGKHRGRVLPVYRAAWAEAPSALLRAVYSAAAGTGVATLLRLRRVGWLGEQVGSRGGADFWKGTEEKKDQR